MGDSDDAKTQADFLEKRPLPDPLGLSETAQGLLAVAEKPVE